MATARFAAVLAGGAAVSSAAAAEFGAQAQVTPVQKVLTLMHGMLAKGKDEKHAEEVQYSAFKQFCDDTSSEKSVLISDGNKRISKLKADIEKHIADAARLTKELAAHEQDISTWTGEVETATSVRAQQKQDYGIQHKDLSESVDALNRAIDVLSKQDYSRSQASALVQLRDQSLIPPEAKRTIDAFLAEGGGSGAFAGLGAPEAAGYEFQSQGIIEMLSKLLDKFMGERTQTEVEERNALQAFTLAKQDLEGQIAQANYDVKEKTATKAKTLEAKATAESDLADTTATRDADTKYLDDLTATCNKKASDFNSRQQLRSDEITAISKAIEIISSSAVAGNADKHLPALLQRQGKKTAFAQLRVDSEGVYKARAAAYLQKMGAQLHSEVLSSLAAKVVEDPFVKVKKMLKDLIVRLMEEANEEAEHKGWCDTELTTNAQTRTEKTTAVETLHAEVDQLEASIAKLTDDITVLTQAVADLDKAMAAATSIRTDEKAANAATVKDSKDAQAAVTEAMAVLQEFYERAGDATVFVQQQPVAPEIFDAAEQGQQAGAGNVIGFLEVIKSDFARLQAETETAEQTAQNEYDGFMTDSQVDKDSKTTDLQHKENKKQDHQTALAERSADLDGTQKELDAALAYFDKLKPTCVDAGVSYKERVSRREEEIQSLKEALDILNGKTV